MTKLLSIGIPTYNRARCLDKNLSLIEDSVLRYDLKDIVDVIISNNCSLDDTSEIILEHKRRGVVEIISVDRPQKISIQNNQISVIEMSDSKYVMHLSDDDYLDPEYLINVVRLLTDHSEIGCVVPNYVAYTDDGTFLFSRDPKAKNKFVAAGFETCLKYSKLAHQMSGLVYRREGLIEEYHRREVDNMYPFIFFIAYCSLYGKLYYLSEYPVRVTDVPQEKKDWSYGKDGLVLEVFDNYIKLEELSRKQRCRLEIDFIKTDPSRFLNYKKIYSIARAIYIVVSSTRTLFEAKVFCLLFIPYLYIRRKLSRILK